MSSAATHVFDITDIVSLHFPVAPPVAPPRPALSYPHPPRPSPRPCTPLRSSRCARGLQSAPQPPPSTEYNPKAPRADSTSQPAHGRSSHRRHRFARRPPRERGPSPRRPARWPRAFARSAWGGQPPLLSAGEGATPPAAASPTTSTPVGSGTTIPIAPLAKIENRGAQHSTPFPYTRFFVCPLGP